MTERPPDHHAEPLYCGVDVGASSTKLVLLDRDREVRGRSIRRSGVDYQATARACLEEALEEAGAEEAQLRRTVSTGYGRRNVDFADDARTELSCHGVGCYHHYPSAITIVDIGCQDNKIIRLDESGRRVDFKMNRKCAAGTGAFLEEIALRLDIALDELEELASGTNEAVRLNSFCTVFASTEILSHLRRGEPLAGLVRGAFASVVSRVAEMDQLHGEVVLTGGVVAHNPTTAEIFAEKLGGEVKIPPHPQFTGALGAALTALAQEERNA
jgi:predicted CoA-substrate-specific enzyme activase